jgi:hypothetical protein
MRLLPIVALMSLLLPTACGRSDRAQDRGQQALVPRLDASNVPEDLRPLVPMVQEWGIGDDVDRGHKVEGATPEERQRLRQGLTPHQARITAWLNSFGQGVMPPGAAAFMYTQLALEEISAAEGH